MWSKDRLLVFPLLLFLSYSLFLFNPTLVPLSCSSPKERGEERVVAWAREQHRRRANLARACASDLSWTKNEWERSPNNKQTHFIYNPDHNILGCLQPKVGSTTWYRHFLSLTNSSTRKELEKFGRADQERLMAPSDPDIINLARASVSFSMVRHPFERIVSAYKDKIENWDRTESVWKHVRTICETQFGDTSFNSFVKMLTATNKQVLQKLIFQSLRQELDQSFCPTLLEGKPCCLNPHWAPLVERCLYCSTPYTVIAKFETFEDDLWYISHLANVSLDSHLRENPTKTHRKDSISSSAVTYFQKLSVADVEALFMIYKKDFQMFGYSPQLYKDTAS